MTIDTSSSMATTRASPMVLLPPSTSSANTIVLQTKTILYFPWTYGASTTAPEEDTMLEELHLLDLMVQSPPTAAHEDEIRSWVQTRLRASSNSDNDESLLPFPIQILLGLLIKYRASTNLIMDLFTSMMEHDANKGKNKKSRSLLLYHKPPPGQSRLSLLGFAMFVDAHPDLIHDLITADSSQAGDEEEDDDDMGEDDGNAPVLGDDMMKADDEEDDDPVLVAWDQVSLRIVAMLCRQESVRQAMGANLHDMFLLMLLLSSKPITAGGVSNLPATTATIMTPTMSYDSRMELILTCWSRYYVQMTCFQLLRACFYQWFQCSSRDHNSSRASRASAPATPPSYQERKNLEVGRTSSSKATVSTTITIKYEYSTRWAIHTLKYMERRNRRVEQALVERHEAMETEAVPPPPQPSVVVVSSHHHHHHHNDLQALETEGDAMETTTTTGTGQAVSTTASCSSAAAASAMMESQMALVQRLQTKRVKLRREHDSEVLQLMMEMSRQQQEARRSGSFSPSAPFSSPRPSSPSDAHSMMMLRSHHFPQEQNLQSNRQMAELRAKQIVELLWLDMLIRDVEETTTTMSNSVSMMNMTLDISSTSSASI